eukprot:g4677.t1
MNGMGAKLDRDLDVSKNTVVFADVKQLRSRTPTDMTVVQDVHGNIVLSEGTPNQHRLAGLMNCVNEPNRRHESGHCTAIRASIATHANPSRSPKSNVESVGFLSSEWFSIAASRGSCDEVMAAGCKWAFAETRKEMDDMRLELKKELEREAKKLLEDENTGTTGSTGATGGNGDNTNPDDDLLNLSNEELFEDLVDQSFHEVGFTGGEAEDKPFCSVSAVTMLIGLINDKIADQQLCGRMLKSKSYFPIKQWPIEKQAYLLSEMCACWESVPDEEKNAMVCRPTVDSKFTMENVSENSLDNLCSVAMKLNSGKQKKRNGDQVEVLNTSNTLAKLLGQIDGSGLNSNGKAQVEPRRAWHDEQVGLRIVHAAEFKMWERQLSLDLNKNQQLHSETKKLFKESGGKIGRSEKQFYLRFLLRLEGVDTDNVSSDLLTKGLFDLLKMEESESLVVSTVIVADGDVKWKPSASIQSVIQSTSSFRFSNAKSNPNQVGTLVIDEPDQKATGPFPALVLFLAIVPSEKRAKDVQERINVVRTFPGTTLTAIQKTMPNITEAHFLDGSDYGQFPKGYLSEFSPSAGVFSLKKVNLDQCIRNFSLQLDEVNDVDTVGFVSKWCVERFKAKGLDKLLRIGILHEICAKCEARYFEELNFNDQNLRSSIEAAPGHTKDDIAKGVCEEMRLAINANLAADSSKSIGAVDKKLVVAIQSPLSWVWANISKQLTTEQEKEDSSKQQQPKHFLNSSTQKARAFVDLVCADKPHLDMCQNNCCAAHLRSGCGNNGVMVCVCKRDSYCCDYSWDQTCVDLVGLHGCAADCKLEIPQSQNPKDQRLEKQHKRAFPAADFYRLGKDTKKNGILKAE